jgi:hypothetical protein
MSNCRESSSVLYLFFINTNSWESLLTSYTMSKNDVLMYILTISIKNLAPLPLFLGFTVSNHP